jgi:hypothetical protein
MADTKQFNFFESYYRSFQNLPPEVVGEVVKAMGAYFFENEIIELNGLSQAVFELIKPVMDSSKKKAENGSKGGAPKGNSNAKKQAKNKQKQANDNQKTSNEQAKTSDKEKEKEKDKEIGNRIKDIGVQGETETAPAVPLPFVDYESIVNDYKTTCKSLPEVRSLSDGRRKAIKARIRTRGVEEIHKAFVMAEESDFLKGANDRNWVADFDWIMNDTNMAKILDGKYENRVSRASPKEDGYDWLGRQLKEGGMI